MTTLYPYPQNDHKKPLDAQVKPVVVVDPGNRFIKWIEGQTPRVIPSYIKQLADWEDAEPDSQSYVVGINDHRYVIGKLAQDLGGKPVFQEGKAELVHILVLPCLAHPEGLSQRIEKLIIPTPDSRNHSVVDLLKKLETTLDFTFNGINQVTTVRQIQPIDECRSSFNLASSKKLWKFPDRLNGIFDCGGGTAIARLFTPSGVLIREADTILPGTFALTQKLAATLLPVVGQSPDLGLLMDAIATNNYTYGSTGVEFSKQFFLTKDNWISEIRNKLKIAWNQYLPNLGEVLIVGGSAPLLQPLVEAAKGRFKLSPQPQLFSLYGLQSSGNKNNS